MKTGYAPQTFQGLVGYRVQACLDLIGGFYEAWDASLVARCRDRWELERHQPVAHLTPGQRQKLAILLAIGHRPDLLVLDEPVASLDPAARRDFLTTLVELNTTQGQTIVFSSHITSDIERIAADVAILHEGRLTCHDNLDTLKESVVYLRLSGKKDLPARLAEWDVIRYRPRGASAQLWVRDWTTERIAALERALGVRAHAQHQNLEDLFLGMTS